jgi:hypothetical protein
VLLDEVEEELAEVVFADRALEGVRQALLTWHAEDGAAGPALLQDHLLAAGFREILQNLSTECRYTTWYRSGIDRAVVLKEWRSCLAQHRQSQVRRAVKLAISEAIAGGKEEASVFRRQADRLINDRPAAKAAQRRDDG